MGAGKACPHQPKLLAMKTSVLNFLKSKKGRGLFLFSIGLIALIILLLVPCPDFLIFILTITALIVVIINFTGLMLDTKLEPIQSSRRRPSHGERGLRTTLLAIGFSASLLIAYLGINFKQCNGSYAWEPPERLVQTPDEEDVVITYQKEKPKPLPPKIITEELFIVKEITKEVEEPLIIEEIPEKPTPIVIPDDLPEIIEEPDVFRVVEQMPSFGSGDKELFSYLSSCIKYPHKALEASIEGTVYLEFVVNEKGDITEIKLKRGIGGGCDEEALRCVKKMPRWNPGKQRGKPVRVLFTLPVVFKIR